MALVPLTRITFHRNDDETEHVYLNQENLTDAHKHFLEYECKLDPKPIQSATYEYTVKGFYTETDIAEFKAALSAALA